MVLGLLKKLTVAQLIKKFPAFHGTQSSVTYLLGILPMDSDLNQ
jgi:hypothetical protein